MSSDEVLACEATRLFIDRARLQRSDLEVGASDAAPLASICRRLDGIALAIELAAPRIRVMSIEELSHRLDDRFRVLTEGSRTALPRHRTLRSLVDWSHDLLTPAEKAVLRRTSVFSGGWTLEAAQHVCGSEEVDPGEVLNLVTSLVDKNLAMADAAGGVTRFTMLETVRHYARDRLVESGDVHAHARHVEHFLGMATKLHQECNDDERKAMLDRVEKEYDNFRAALAWCEANTAHAPSGLRLAARLNWFWRTRGSFSEGRAWIARLLAAAPGDVGDEDRAWALNTVGVLAYFQDDFAASDAGYGAALAIWRRLGNREREAAEITNLGHLAYTKGDFDIARKRYEEALDVARELGDPRGPAVRLRALGILSRELGDYPAAQALLEECVAVSHKVGNWSVIQALGNLGWVKHLRGDSEGARPLIVESLEGERKFGNKAGVALNLIWLGRLCHEEGEIPAATAHLKEAIGMHLELGMRSTMVDALEAFACLSLALVDASCSVRILGGTQRLREEIGVTWSDLEKARFERDVAAARHALRDDAAFDRAWNEGRSMSLEEVGRYALTL